MLHTVLLSVLAPEHCYRYLSDGKDSFSMYSLVRRECDFILDDGDESHGDQSNKPGALGSKGNLTKCDVGRGRCCGARDTRIGDGDVKGQHTNLQGMGLEQENDPQQL